ncbi:MAG: DUF3419 family protein [Bacilli bacterium]|nr:DUF3419 family protein [Bacilli bacterium]
MTKEYLEELKKYLLKNGKLDPDFGPYSKMYSMTTENIAGFLNNLDLKDKNVLTVAASGDQRINAYMLGAKNVTCFDINPLTKLQLNLKDTTLKIVNFEKFINFFGIYSGKYGSYYKYLDKEIFKEIKNDLDEDTFKFFDYIINGNQNIGSHDIYQSFDNNLDLLKNMNNYLTKDSFDLAKQVMSKKKIDFIKSDIKALPDKLGNNKYDLILLSNISDYIHLMYEDRSLYYYRELIDGLIEHLNLFGTIQVGYIYSNYHKGNDTSNFKYKDQRLKYFPTREFHTMQVDSYNNRCTKDKIITFQKLK